MQSIPFYKRLLDRELYADWTISEKLLYSFYVAKSYSNDFVEQEYKVLPNYSKDKLGKLLHLSRQFVYVAHQGLVNKGMVTEDGYVCTFEDFACKGILTMQCDTPLKGELWIFYEWLKELCTLFGENVIKASNPSLAKMFQCKKDDIKGYLRKLRSKGMCERTYVPKYQQTYLVVKTHL